MHCHHCHAPVLATDRYCVSCGSALAPPQEPDATMCEACGAVVVEGDLFCTACGARFEARLDSRLADEPMPPAGSMPVTRAKARAGRARALAGGTVLLLASMGAGYLGTRWWQGTRDGTPSADTVPEALTEHPPLEPGSESLPETLATPLPTVPPPGTEAAASTAKPTPDPASRPASSRREPVTRPRGGSAQPPAEAPMESESVAPAPPAPVVRTPTPDDVPAEPSTARVYDIRQVDVRPRVLDQVQPRYPRRFEAQRPEQVIVLSVLVSPKGRVTDVRVLRPSALDAAFDQAAVAAARQWTFEPAQRRGEAVACWFNVAVAFRAGDR